MPVKLTLVLSGRTIARHEFKDFKRLRVGRNEDCDVTIDNLGISRVHCELVKKPGYVQLRDLQSGNGTFVNGKRTQSHNLNSGDTISLGKYKIRYDNDEESSASPLSRGELGDGGMMTLQLDAAALARKHREEQGKNRAYVSVQGAKDVVLEKSLTTFGSDALADVRLSGWFCPRVVAVVVRDESGFRLVDVSPRGNAVSINGVRRRDTILNDNDELVLKGTRITFRRGLPVGAHMAP